MICMEIVETGERIMLENPLWLTRNRNGIHATPHRVKALGVGDGEQIWSFGSLEGYPAAKVITLAEYAEYSTPPDPDPELTDGEAFDIIFYGGQA